MPTSCSTCRHSEASSRLESFVQRAASTEAAFFFSRFPRNPHPASGPPTANRQPLTLNPPTVPTADPPIGGTICVPGTARQLVGEPRQDGNVAAVNRFTGRCIIPGFLNFEAPPKGQENAKIGAKLPPDRCMLMSAFVARRITGLAPTEPLCDCPIPCPTFPFTANTEAKHSVI